MSLRTILSVLFHSRQPMFLYWGPELIQFYNDAYLPSFGAGKHPKAMGQRGEDCWQEIWPIIFPQIEGVMLHGHATWHEDQLVPIFRNGRIEDVYWTYGFSPVFDETGAVGGTLVVCTETTNRVLAERRLRAAHVLTERTRGDSSTFVQAGSFGEAADDVPFAMVYLIDAGGLRLESSIGLDDSEVAIVGPFVADQLRRALSPDGGEAQDGRSAADPDGMVLLPPLVREDSAPRAFLATMAGRTAGSVMGVILFGLTPKLPFDAPFRAHLDQLADILAAAISRELLRASEEKARKRVIFTDRMASVGALAAGVAHEINNPLAYVTANLDMAVEQIRDLANGSPSLWMQELEQMLVEARTGGDRIRKIVRALRISSRSEDEKERPVNVKSVLEVSLTMTMNQIRSRANLVKEYGAIPAVQADEARLGQVFTNLLVNAAEATPDGDPGSHEIRVVTSTDPEGRAIIEVRDTGTGIPDETMKHIFDPFFTTKPVGVGTGIGLFICHSLVTGMGGEITVGRNGSRGTIVRISLPASVALPLPTVVAGIEPPPAGADVLIVDDDPLVGGVLARTLKGHRVAKVTSARAALDLLDSGRRFDVILSDLMMPEMSGMELHEEIGLRFPEMLGRMVFVTGGTFTSAGKEFVDRVSNPFVEKPFNMAEIRKLVDTYVPKPPGE